MEILTVSLLLAVLLVQAKGDPANNVGVCNFVNFDDTFNFTLLPSRMYVHSITDRPGVNLVDGIVHTYATGVESGVLVVSSDVHKKDGTIKRNSYKDVMVKKGIVQEIVTDENGDETEFYEVTLGTIPECGVIVYYRCSFEGTLDFDVIYVIKKEMKPLSDDCQKKVAEVSKGKDITVKPAYTMPYALTNYS